FDAIHYCITDYLAVGSYEVTSLSTAEMAAFHIGPLLTNPRVVIAAVADRPDILAAIDEFKRYGFTSAPYEVFSSLAEARAWVAQGPRAGKVSKPPG
ncbi:MAG: hypothetical protein RJA10_1932, partial [Pseudomonadota bacterium]